MRRLCKPNWPPSDVFAACISGVADPMLSARFAAALLDITAIAPLYEERAVKGGLHAFDASEHGLPDQLVMAGLTKAELMSLYSTQMANSKRAARTYYDSLMMTAPLGKCPYCGFGHASTLDHFLAKARYPALSILPVNLVPACADCNFRKGSPVITEDTESSHPYFESERIEREVWLFASIVESTPATASFRYQSPASWDPPLARRMKNYFETLDLAARFSLEAASEIISVSALLRNVGAPEGRRMHLLAVAQSERSLRRNSWKAALYEALSASSWYQDCGCLQER